MKESIEKYRMGYVNSDEFSRQLRGLSPTRKESTTKPVEKIHHVADPWDGQGIF